MKTLKTKLIAVAGLFGLGIALFSFGSADEPKFIRYEVIRSVDGEIKTYDTLIDANSTFTPEQYLAELGFSADPNVEIIHVPHHGDGMMCMPHPGCNGFPGDSTAEVSFEINTENFEGTDVPGQMMIKKNITVKTIDDGNGETVETHEVVEIVELDSLMELHLLNGGDSSMVFVHEIVVGGCDGKSSVTTLPTIGCEPTYERHSDDGTSKMDMMVFADGEDFTILIVSDGSATSILKSQMIIETDDTAPEGMFKVFPNPASKEVSIQLNFEEKETTTILVTDMNGKVVLELSLGEFSGNYTHNMDVSKWSKGIYLVKVNRPNVKLVEKLVIE